MQQLKQEHVPVTHSGQHPLVQDTSGSSNCSVATDADDYYTLEFNNIALTSIPVLLLSRIVHKWRLLVRNVVVRLKEREGNFANPFQKAFIVQLQIFYEFVELPRRQLQLELYQYREYRKTVADEKLQQLARVIQQDKPEVQQLM